MDIKTLLKHLYLKIINNILYHYKKDPIPNTTPFKVIVQSSWSLTSYILIIETITKLRATKLTVMGQLSQIRTRVQGAYLF